MSLRQMNFSVRLFVGSSHIFPVILFNIGSYTYTIRYRPGIKNTWFFSKISKKKIQNVFFKRISFNIGL